MTRRQAAGGGELFAVGGAAGVLAPGQLAGILVQIRTGDMMMLADLGAAQPGEIAFRLIGTGTIHAVGATVVDASHLVPRVKIIPGARLVGMDDTASGDTLGSLTQRYVMRHRIWRNYNEISLLDQFRVRGAKVWARGWHALRTAVVKAVTGTRISVRAPVRRGGVAP